MAVIDGSNICSASCENNTLNYWDWLWDLLQKICMIVKWEIYWLHYFSFVYFPATDWHWFFCILQSQWPLGWSGSTTLSGGTVQQPYGRYRLEPTSPTSVESIRMVTLRIKLNKNIVQGEIGCFFLCFLPAWCFSGYLVFDWHDVAWHG